MLQDNYVVGVDIGGTHISACIIDTKQWNIHLENVVRNHVFSQGDAKTILHTWASTIQDIVCSAPAAIQFVGIAMPGPFDYENGISKMQGQSKYDKLYNKDIKSLLAAELNLAPTAIHFINDAAAFLQGEIFVQNLQSNNRILGITLGTGLGSAVWNQGEKAFDADLWNTPYAESIFEEYLVTRWFVRRFKELTGKDVSGLKEILENYRESDAFELIKSEYATHLFDFMAFFSKKYQSNIFVIGGNIAKALPIFIAGREQFDAFKLYTAVLGEKAAMIGAASIFS
ncbi:ROK family protein [Sphingobacterium thalpophilum]|uniref:D-allose kinase n=1 Tax=Sphingobacterium thalpophilum TaxID=259 RepID=A0A4U9UDG2_9SPHI|nr:ROK family protein [Sphingobacterium thalpophilum]VTR30019.1 D-allose kinase [Sphingobacterium thalpophilum]